MPWKYGEKGKRIRQTPMFFHVDFEHGWPALNVTPSTLWNVYECLQESIGQRTSLSLHYDVISDEATDVFRGFLHEKPCDFARSTCYLDGTVSLIGAVVLRLFIRLVRVIEAYVLPLRDILIIG
jgi:hypothetical protein